MALRLRAVSPAARAACARARALVCAEEQRSLLPTPASRAGRHRRAQQNAQEGHQAAVRQASIGAPPHGRRRRRCTKASADCGDLIGSRGRRHPAPISASIAMSSNRLPRSRTALRAQHLRCLWQGARPAGAADDEDLSEFLCGHLSTVHDMARLGSESPRPHAQLLPLLDASRVGATDLGAPCRRARPWRAVWCVTGAVQRREVPRDRGARREDSHLLLPQLPHDSSVLPRPQEVSARAHKSPHTPCGPVSRPCTLQSSLCRASVLAAWA